ncbi:MULTISPECIES: MarR family winged helix-turn-helix transcriptional regulator [unclassified Clostridium]|uniref:MarR family winged helix-turn-helix transcriptional regulator n=1 Tax=unclassified Clostridium TaxID=2614128 RepID=UPI001EEF5246|nr:MarR family transcriptional regulator [Clostridium sp. UBA1652]
MSNKEELIEQIDSYYESWFEINNIYSIWAKKHGIQDTTLFTLYIIKTSVPYCTQNKICSKLLLPKQTISVIIASLEKNGYVFRETNPEDRRNKIVRFTEAGEKFADNILEKLKLAEIEAFSQLSSEQRTSIIGSFKLLSNSLKKEM